MVALSLEKKFEYVIIISRAPMTLRIGKYFQFYLDLQEEENTCLIPNTQVGIDKGYYSFSFSTQPK